MGYQAGGFLLGFSSFWTPFRGNLSEYIRREENRVQQKVVKRDLYAVEQARKQLKKSGFKKVSYERFRKKAQQIYDEEEKNKKRRKADGKVCTAAETLEEYEQRHN